MFLKVNILLVLLLVFFVIRLLECTERLFDALLNIHQVVTTIHQIFKRIKYDTKSTIKPFLLIEKLITLGINGIDNVLNKHK